jgi:hypothetical protein
VQQEGLVIDLPGCRLGELAWPAARAALKTAVSLEQRRRLEKLLRAADSTAVTGEILQHVRALESLEQIGTADSRQLLENVARAAGSPTLRRAARQAIERLKTR